MPKDLFATYKEEVVKQLTANEVKYSDDDIRAQFDGDVPINECVQNLTEIYDDKMVIEDAGEDEGDLDIEDLE